MLFEEGVPPVSRRAGSLIFLVLSCEDVAYLGEENFLFGGLKESIQPSKHEHGKNDISVLSTKEHVPEDVIGNSPYKTNELAVYSSQLSGIFHF